MPDPLPPVPVSEHTLANGLLVLLYEDRSLPLVAVNVSYAVGSKDDPPVRTGLAHLFEHMMFQGSAHFDDDYFKALQDTGASVNGATNTDRTRYWELLPSGYLERALWLEADRMGFLLDALTQERLDNQIAVVQNERRQNYDNRPYGTVWEKVLAVLYPPNHPYSWPTIGFLDHIQAVTLQEVRGFFRTHYAPGNAALCIAGDVERSRALDLAELYFGSIPPGPPASSLTRWMPRPVHEAILELEDRVQVPRSTVVWPSVPVYSADDAAIDVFARVVGGGKSSRLYTRLVHERQIAQDANLVHASAQLAGTLRLTLTPRPGHALTEVEDAAHAVIAEALEGGVTAAELERAKAVVSADFVRSLQRLGGFGGISDRIGEYVHYLGTPDRFTWDLDRTLALTADDVVRAARRVVESGRVVARVTPPRAVVPVAAAPAAGPDRSVIPSRGRQSRFSLPARQRFRLANGLEVVLVEKPPLPLVHCALLLRGGAAVEPADLGGLASLAVATAQERAGGRTAPEIAEALEALGAELTLGADTDAVVGRLSVLGERLEPACAILTDILARPDFASDDFARQRARRQVRLAQLADQPPYLADVALRRVVHGDHPYGRPLLGTTTSVESARLEHARAYWERVAVPGNATLVVVGNVSRAGLERALTATLGRWRGGAAPDVRLTPPAPRDRRTLTLLHRPGAPQSLVAMGDLAPRRATEDYPALTVLNAVLGGQFVSRLNLNLREGRGVTYGVRSSLDLGLVAGTLAVVTQVQTAATSVAVRETLVEMTAVRGSRPPTPDEVRDAVASIVNGYLLGFETAPQMARALAEQVLHGLADDDLERYPERVAALTPDDVARAGGELLRPERLAVVVVGDRDATLTDLRGLGLEEADPHASR